MPCFSYQWEKPPENRRQDLQRVRKGNYKERNLEPFLEVSKQKAKDSCMLYRTSKRACDMVMMTIFVPYLHMNRVRTSDLYPKVPRIDFQEFDSNYRGRACTVVDMALNFVQIWLVPSEMEFEDEQTDNT
jgi:hypothetical protein